MPELSFEEKRLRAREIEAKIAALEDELREIYSPTPKNTHKKKTVEVPSEFGNFRSRILEFISSRGDGGSVNKLEINKWIKETFNFQPTDTQIQGALSNLKAEGKLEIVSRGFYTLKKAS
jgi:hypothetical protein